MIKTIIIDDEEIIREGLIHSMPWSELGYEIVGEAADGEEAIKIIQETKPDVIIADISMPFINGLELIEFIKPILKDPIIIIISGHNEFEYAQQALQLGVYDYITKPFDFDYFTKLLKKIKFEQTMKKRMGTYSSEDLRNLQSTFLSAVIRGKYSKTRTKEQIAKFSFAQHENSYYALIITQLDHYNLTIANLTLEQVSDLQNSYYAILNQAIENKSNIFLIEGQSGDASIVVVNEFTSQLNLEIKKMLTELRKSLSLTNFSVTFGVSLNHQSIYNLPICYKEAMQATQQRFINGYNKDYFLSQLNLLKVEQKNEKTPTITFDAPQFTHLLKSNDEKQLIKYFDDMFERLLKNDHSPSMFSTIFASSVYMHIITFLQNYDLTIDDICENQSTLYESITTSKDINSIKAFLLKISTKTMNSIAAIAASSHNSPVEAAKQFIEENYSSPDITLQMVANHVNMGICYFSTTFKKETGESVINYLTKIRVEKAKELFEQSSYKTYEVAFMVGYNTPTYFSTLFKKITGASPSEYRNMAQMNKNGLNQPQD